MMKPDTLSAMTGAAQSLLELPDGVSWPVAQIWLRGAVRAVSGNPRYAHFTAHAEELLEGAALYPAGATDEQRVSGARLAMADFLRA